MNAKNLNEQIMETQEICKKIEKKINSNNLELLIQCERNGDTDDKLLEKTRQLKTILNELKTQNNSAQLEKTIASISESNRAVSFATLPITTMP